MSTRDPDSDNGSGPHSNRVATWLSALKAQFKDVLRRTEKVEDKTDDHADRIARLETEVAAHGRWLNDHEGKLDERGGSDRDSTPVSSDAPNLNPLAIPLGVFLARLLLAALTVVGTAAITYAIWQALSGAAPQEAAP